MNKIIVSLRLSEDLLPKLDRLAESQKRTRSNMVEWLILQRLAESQSWGITEPSKTIERAEQ